MSPIEAGAAVATADASPTTNRIEEHEQGLHALTFVVMIFTSWLARRLRIVHTPRNGSWLNMAEIELSILSRQCIGRRFDSVEQMIQAINAWQSKRNQSNAGANWRFTTDDARIKLKALYPVHDE